MRTSAPARRLLTKILVCFAMLGMNSTLLSQVDVTQPGDPIAIVNGENDGDPDTGPPPLGEAVEHSIDNLGLKYLNFLDLGSGFAVQPQVGLTFVTALTIYTANDEPARDPASFLLEGSSTGLAGPWTQIASGSLALPDGRNFGGNTPLGANSQTVTFANPTPYAAYRLTFPTLKNAAAANSMQIGEVELIGTVVRPVLPPNGPGNALSFDGVDDYLSVVHSPGLNAYPLTISAWVRTSRNAALFDGILSKYIDGSLNGYSLFLHNGRVRGFYFRNPANYVWDGSLGLDGGFVADGAWHHVALVVDADGGRLVVDGAVRATLPWTGTSGATTTTDGFQIGRYWTLNNGFLGQADEVRVWNVGRTAAQIQADIRRQLIGEQIGLVAYYRFDEGMGLSAFDATGNSVNPAMLINGPTWTNSTILPFAPTVTTLTASPLTTTTATLNGSANPNGAPTTACFQWGTTTSYGNITSAQSLGSGTSSVNWSLQLTGLTPDTIYHFRAVATNIHGASFGTDQVFPLELGIARDANGRITVSWLTNFNGFQLESKPSLASGSWNPVLPAPTVVSNRNVVTNTVSGASQFYRLRRP